MKVFKCNGHNGRFAGIMRQKSVDNPGMSLLLQLYCSAGTFGRLFDVIREQFDAKWGPLARRQKAVWRPGGTLSGGVGGSPGRTV